MNAPRIEVTQNNYRLVVNPSKNGSPSSSLKLVFKRVATDETEKLHQHTDKLSEKKTKVITPWDVALKLIQEIPFVDDSIPGFFEGLFETDNFSLLDKNRLMAIFSEGEISLLIAYLDWYHLITQGFLSSLQHAENFLSVQNFLKITHCLDILDPEKGNEISNNPLPLSALIKRMENFREQAQVPAPPFEAFQLTMEGVFNDYLAAGDMIDSLGDLFKIDVTTEDSSGRSLYDYISVFSVMDTAMKVRWVLFTSIAAHHLNSHHIMGLTTTCGETFTRISSELRPLLYLINDALRRAIKKDQDSRHNSSKIKGQKK